MGTTHTDNIGYWLSVELRDGSVPPTSFRILPSGVTHTTKGEVLFDDSSAESVTKLLAEHGRAQLPIDYDHGMLAAVTTPDTGRAAGWFTPAIKDGELWAMDIEWTEGAAAALSKREFRFFSPALELEPGTRRVTRLINVALTNLPATMGQVPLVASDKPSPGKGEIEEQDMSKLLELLGAKDDAEATTIIETLSKANDGLLELLGAKDFDAAETAVKELQLKASEATKASLELAERVAALELSAIETEKAALIAELSEAGKLPPSLHDFASKLDRTALLELAEALPTMKPTETKAATETIAKLSDAESKLLSQFSVSEEDYLKTSAALAKKGSK